MAPQISSKMADRVMRTRLLRAYSTKPRIMGFDFSRLARWLIRRAGSCEADTCMARERSGEGEMLKRCHRGLVLRAVYPKSSRKPETPPPLAWAAVLCYPVRLKCNDHLQRSILLVVIPLSRTAEAALL